MARASIHLMNTNKKNYDKIITTVCNHINIGSGKEHTIKELAEIIKKVVGFRGRINFDPNKPDGTYRKVLDINKIKETGFKPQINLKDGIIKTYKDYIKVNTNF